MRGHLGTRIAQIIPTLLLVSILVFCLQQLMPGDPALVMAGEERGDPQVLAQIRAELWLDRPLPEEVYARPPVQGAQSRYQLIVDLAGRDNLTVRQLIGRLGGGRGHRTFAGTPEQVADTMQEWFDAGAADGFNVMPPVLPSGLEAFADHVVPILRDRGLFRARYAGQTLREHYGLPRPDSQFAVRPGQAVIAEQLGLPGPGLRFAGRARHAPD